MLFVIYNIVPYDAILYAMILYYIIDLYIIRADSTFAPDKHDKHLLLMVFVIMNVIVWLYPQIRFSNYRLRLLHLQLVFIFINNRVLISLLYM